MTGITTTATGGVTVATGTTGTTGSTGTASGSTPATKTMSDVVANNDLRARVAAYLSARAWQIWRGTLTADADQDYIDKLARGQVTDFTAWMWALATDNSIATEIAGGTTVPDSDLARVIEAAWPMIAPPVQQAT